MAYNPMCDGSHCTTDHGEVRLYPLTNPILAMGQAILCKSCFQAENTYAIERGWQTRDWDTATPVGKAYQK